MKTPMQELIDIITTELEISEDIVQYSEQELNVFARVRNSAFGLLEKEKEHICNAYVEGLEGLYIGAEEYYNKEYNQKGLDDETRELLDNYNKNK